MMTEDHGDTAGHDQEPGCGSGAAGRQHFEVPPDASGTTQGELWYKRDFHELSPHVLYRKMRKTAMARFNCAIRLSYQHKVLQWSLPLLSAALLILALLAKYGILGRPRERQIRLPAGGSNDSSTHCICLGIFP